MPNHSVFNDEDQPVYVEMTNSYLTPDISAPPEMNAAQNTVLYSANASASATVVLALISAISSVRIANPAGSGRTFHISRISGSIGGSSLLSAMSGTFSIVRGGTLTSPATLTPVNNNLGSSAASVATAQTSTSVISGGLVLYSYQLAPGTFSQPFSGSIVLPPGSALSVSVVSSSSAIGLTITSAVSLVWWESPA